MSRSTRSLRKGCAHTGKNRSRQSGVRRRGTRRRGRVESLETRQVLSAVPLDAAGLEAHVVYSTDEAIELSDDGQRYAQVDHSAAMELDAGTVAVTFTADDVNGRTTLFSKDHSGLQDGGHLTVWIVDGRVEARFQSDSGAERLRSAVGAINAGEEHQVAFSFGERGARLYVDGLIADAEVDFDQGIAANANPLIVGADITSSNGDNLNLKRHFDGTIESLTVYDAELGLEAAADLAGLDLDPPTTPTSIDGVYQGTEGSDLFVGYRIADSYLDAGYGNDAILGGPDAETLVGGHGEDIVIGGGGDDLLISRSDGREPVIAQLYGVEDDPDGEIDPTTRTLYPDQPIAADDVLIGGPGADTFRFEILVNAKERILFKHVEDDGTIDWKGVTGENNDVHDHWVDRIGDEAIWDFSREEGDFIEFVGHTVDVYKVEHVDSDGDGVLDASVMHVQSNQGNAGAHNKDQLGTVTVYGDLVLPSDYHVHAHANLGIVETIGELGEALAPRYGTPVVTDGESRWLQSSVREAALPQGAVFAVGQEIPLSGEDDDYLEAAHTPALELEDGAVAVAFTLDSTEGRQALFSKDHSGLQDGGHLTAWVVDGRVEVRLQSDSGEEKLRSAEGAITAGEQHHVVVSFGEDGARLYVDGLIADAEVDFDQGIAANTNPLVIGASAIHRDGDRVNARDEMAGVVHEFAVYDTQSSLEEVAELAGLDLTPLAEPTEIGGVLFGTDAGETLAGQFVLAGYGDDTVTGTDEADILDGGHGEDALTGGLGDDLLISRSDGREPVIAQLYGVEDDPDGEIDPTTRTLYPDQPIAADDVLTGGEGADTFRFEILVNAKERILFKHVEDDGTIDWKGVTGENNDVHDHWVDRIGDEVITDFNREEGDFIEFVGHTVDVYKVEHVDSDGDGVLDASVMHVQSNQGNAGAHNKDQLGTVTVYGDLVLPGDYHVHAHANLGIVETIGELGEALAPRYGTPVVTDGESRWLLDEVEEAPLPQGAVFAVGQPIELPGDKEAYVEVPHGEALELENGAVAVSFTTDDISGRQTLFSKDHSGLQDGGHLTVWVVDGEIEARFQSAEKSVRLHSAAAAITPGEEHHVVVSFGEDGARLYVDGLIADAEVDFDQSIAANTSSLVIGVSTAGRDGDRLNAREPFAGVIHDLVVYGYQPSLAEAAELAGLDLAPLAEPTEIDGVLYGTDAGEELFGEVVVAAYGDDTVTGTPGADVLDGGHGEDIVVGGPGDDLLISRSDGREPVIAQDYSGEDPDGEVNDATRTLYPDQPIAADDLLIGGPGSDTFRFEILLNAKERILFKHVEDDGTIDWAGVTGENRDVHDHWVDRIGDEVIADFNREEGDFIEFVGHTVDVYEVTYEDTDGDGVLDASVLHVQSNQGNAGAHNKDQLGTVTVFGDLVRAGDYHVHAHANLGIVETIGELGEAFAPRYGTPVVTDGESRWLPGEVDEPNPLPAGAVLATGQPLEFNGADEDYLAIAHGDLLELDEGTVAFTFTADDVGGRQALFSKDHSGFEDGGHLTAWVVDGRVEVRFQSAEKSEYLRSSVGSIEASEAYDFAFSFGEDGARLYLDGALVDEEVEFTQGIAPNENSLVLGAGATTRNGDRANLKEFFTGDIVDFAVYDEAFADLP